MPTLSRTGALLVFALCGCTDLPKLAANVCGNAVIEAGEDCDTFPPGDGMRCLPPGDAHACRLTCAPSGSEPAPRCPDGWRCGLDLLCRRPSGDYAPAGNSLAVGAWSAAVGDFDGDGRKDVLTRGPPDIGGGARTRVHFFDDEAELALSRVIPTSMASPVIARVDADARDDLICGVGGILTWLGTSERTLLPVASPSFLAGSAKVRLIPVNLPLNGGTHFYVLTVVNKKTVIAEPATLQTPLVELGSDALMADLAGDPIPVQLNEDKYACQSFVLAFKGQTQVTVYRPCTVNSITGEVIWNSGLSPLQILLPDPIADGVFVGDLNADKHADLFVSVNATVTVDGVTKVAPRVRIAYGDGTGHFASATSLIATPDDKASDTFWTFTIDLDGVARTATLLVLPLAMGDVTGDGVPDFVLGSGIMLSFPAPSQPGGTVYYPQWRTLTGVWTQAAIADLNGNGLPDIVATSSEDLDLDFFNGTGTTAVIEATIPTGGKVANLLVGDFDGDLVQDVLFSRPGASKDSLFIAFGAPSGPPLAPVKVGEVRSITQLAATGDWWVMPPVAMLSQPTVGGATGEASVSLLFGTSDRQPLAPGLLARGSQEDNANTDVPLVLAVGDLTGQGQIDVLAFAYSKVWSSKSGSNMASWAALGSQGQLGKPAELTTPVDFDPDEWPMLAAAADVDGDGRVEVVVLAAKLDPDPNKFLVLASSLRVGRLDRSTLEWNQTYALPDLALKPAASGRLALQDLDGDGRPELVVATGGDPDVSSTRPAVLRVFWNDGAGHFTFTASTPVDGAVRAFDFLHDAQGPHPALVYVTPTSVKRVSAGAHGSLDAPTTLFEGLVDGTGVAVGDVDGDGIEDLAVVDNQNLRVLRGKAVTP